MQVDINNKNPFPKIIFDMKPGEMRKVLSDKMHSGAADAQGAFRSGSAAVPSKEERAALRTLVTYSDTWHDGVF